MNRTKTALAALSLGWLLSGPALAQTAPGWTYGFVPTTAQWNALWASKQDYLGAAPVLVTGSAMSGPLITASSVALAAGFNIQPGVAPTTPNNGDMWITSLGMYVQINGSTVGPFGAATSYTSLALNGCTIGANNFCVTGGAAISGALSSGAHSITGTAVVTNNTANALTAGPNGTTNPTFNVDASTASAATGLNVKGAAAGGGVAVSVLSSNANENLSLAAKGTGSIVLGNNINLSNLAWATASPSIGSGFCTSPSVTNANGSAAFQVNVGTGCAASTGTINMPTAAHGWACHFADITTPASNLPYQTGGTASTVVVTNYVRTTGVAGNFPSSDVLIGECTAY